MYLFVELDELLWQTKLKLLKPMSSIWHEEEAVGYLETE